MIKKHHYTTLLVFPSLFTEMVKRAVYESLETDEFRKAQVPAEDICEVKIRIKSKIVGSDYCLSYGNCDNHYGITVCDTENTVSFSRPFVRKRIEKLLNRKYEKGTNIINLEKALNSEDIADFTEKCKKYFREVNISKTYIWEIKKDALPKKKLRKEFAPQFFF